LHESDCDVLPDMHGWRIGAVSRVQGYFTFPPCSWLACINRYVLSPYLALLLLRTDEQRSETWQLELLQDI